MIKEVITKNSPAAIGPYSQALDCGNLVFLSGQIPVNPQNGQISKDIYEQAHQVFKNIAGILSELNLNFSSIAKTTLFLTDLTNFSVVNEIYASYFQKPYPARSCVQVTALPKGVLIECECIAIK